MSYLEPETTLNQSSKSSDAKLLNPDLIPNAVKNSLLELHEMVCVSKSDSDIKWKRNLLLRPKASEKKSSFKNMKSRSLQNAGNKKLVQISKLNKTTQLDYQVFALTGFSSKQWPEGPSSRFSMESIVEQLIENKQDHME